MINNWFYPVNTRDLTGFKNLKTFQFGKKINIHKGEDLDLTDTTIALLGIGDEAPNKIREALYSLSFPFKKLNIVDLGNARNHENTFLIPILKELMESKIFPIVIGEGVDHIFAQYHAYRFRNQLINMVMVDENIDYCNPRSKDQTYLNKIIDNRRSHLFHFTHIGHQSHFFSPDIQNSLEKKNFEFIRLGRLKNQIEMAEPVIRDADMFSFNLNALRGGECPGVVSPSPSGLFTEEACQLARYAGMSEKLTSAGVFGFNPDNDINQQSAKIAAQIIWYTIDGFYNRKNDYPFSMNGLVEYIVDSKKNNYALTFWKSEKTGRWWIQIPIKTRKKLKRHQLIPCTYQDYLKATQEEIPERLMNAFKRFS